MSDLRRRVGRFRFSKDFIRSREKDLINVFAQGIIIDATSNFPSDCIDYLGYSELFDLVEVGCEAPKYEWYFDEEEPYPAKVNEYGELRIINIKELT